MYLLPLHRNELLEFLPKGATIAEIGVAEGWFSRTLLQTAQPRRLHLIDPWAHQETDGYAMDPNNVSGAEQEVRYELVRHRMREEIDSGRVKTHRCTSAEASSEFEDGYFDWIYIDGLHTYEGVATDLEAYAPKVGESGLILGHDYTNHFLAREMRFGVVEAVDEFVSRSDFEMVALTNEAFPTYLLCRRQESTDQLEHALSAAVEGIASIANFPGRGFQHHLLEKEGALLRNRDGDFKHLIHFT